MKIGVVIVTYNRINELRKAIKLYEEQTFKPEYIIIVNNNSCDGTKEYLCEWENKLSNIDKRVITLSKNLGGSGGFYEGLKESYKFDSEWIWVSDDDAFPDITAFEKMYKFLSSKDSKEIDKIASICGEVINNGQIDLSHRRRIKKGFLNVEQIPIEQSKYSNKEFDIDFFSYVGSAINKKFLEKVGLTEKDYFIYYDDTEHSYRLKEVGRIICVPDIKIVHDVKIDSENNLNWKSYYGIRNKIIFLKKHFKSRYYMVNYIKEKAKCIFRKDKRKNELINAALNDGIKNVQGIHKIYKPGWK